MPRSNRGRAAKPPAGGRRRRNRAGMGGRSGAFGAQEITQTRVSFGPTYGPQVRIARSLAYNLARVGVDGGYYFDWSLSDVPNNSEFTALFAQWKLVKTSITFTWRSSNDANPNRPQFTMAVDPFATTAPTAITEVLQRSNRTWSPNATRTTLQLDVKATAIMLSASGPGSGALVINTLAPKGQWYPTANPQVSYGSLLIWIAGWGISQDVIQVKQDYEFVFRSPV